MLNKLKGLFGKASPEQKAVAPFEVLVPEGRHFAEEPKIAARVMSFLFSAPNDINTIEFQGRLALSNNNELRQFLNLIAGAKRQDILVAQCKSIMFASKLPGALGSFCCTYQDQLHEFTFFEAASPPNLKWEVRRVVHGA
jgi:hypothetical protein